MMIRTFYPLIRSASYPLLVLALLLTGCHDHSNEDGHGHAQGAEEGHGEHKGGHGHSLDTTLHQGGWELFLERPAFVLDHEARFHAHITRMEGYRPLKEGTVTVALTKGGKTERASVDSVRSKGIFSPSLRPDRAGKHELSLTLEAEGAKERFALGKVRVFQGHDSAEAVMASKEGDEAPIPFGKEEAWDLGIEMARARKDTILKVVDAAGEWKSASGETRTLTAGTEGNVLYATPDLLEGERVEEGQVLMRTSGKGLNAEGIGSEVEKAEARYERAKKAYERKEGLHRSGVVPDAELEQAEEAFQVAKSEYEQLVKNYAKGGVTLKAPFSGVIRSIAIDNGAYAERGTSLLTLGRRAKRQLELRIDPEARRAVRKLRKIWVRTGDTIYRAFEGRVLSVGDKVSRKKPRLPVRVELEESYRAPEGLLSQVQLGYGSGELGTLIPEEALLEQYGRYRVLVQKSGEGYELRPVEIGGRNGRWVAITDGLKPGEFVVSEGAYQVRMASNKGQSAGHGHAH